MTGPQTAIVAGTQLLKLTLEKLLRAQLPLDWSDQVERFKLTA